MPYPMEEVIQNTLKGIARAQREYERWSGCWLWEAPEYFMTTYIAREIASHRNFDYSVTLENSVKAAIDDAGGMGQGRPRNDLRPHGRFDILLWWANNTPRTVIEVKRHIRQFRPIQSDVARICSVLNQADTIRNGLVAYYSSLADEPSQLRSLMSIRLEEIEEEARNYVERRGMILDHLHQGTKLDQDSAWTAGVLNISQR